MARKTNIYSGLLTIFLALCCCVCWMLYKNLSDDDHEHKMSQCITLTEGLSLRDYGLAIFYHPDKEDYLRFGIIYEMDSAIWITMKESGADMKIKDAIVVKNVLYPDTSFSNTYSYFDYRIDTANTGSFTKNGVTTRYNSAIRFDIDFTRELRGNITWSYKDIVVGPTARRSSLSYEFPVRSANTAQILYDNSLTSLTINSLPKSFQIKSNPAHDIFFDGIVINKSNLTNVWSDGVYIELMNPANTKRYENITFFLGAAIGALLSGILTFLYSYLEGLKDPVFIRKRKKTADDFSLADPDSITEPVLEPDANKMSSEPDIQVEMGSDPDEKSKENDDEM